MLLVIIATIISCVNAQYGVSIQKPSSEISKNQNNQNSSAKNYGDPIKEEYTDSDGNIKTRSYRYGFQYKDSFKPVKPSGGTSTEAYTNQSGDEGSRSYRYGWQYRPEQESAGQSIKLKAPKLSPPSESSGGDVSSSSSSEPAPASASSPPPASSTASSAGDIKSKDADILNRMKDLIKERQKLKSVK